MEKNLTDLNELWDLRKQALKQLLIQAKKEHNKLLYKELKLRYKKTGADIKMEDSSQDE